MLCELPVAGGRLTIAEFTRPELIVPALRETDPAGIIEELSHCLRVNKVVDDTLSFYHDVLNQEFLSNSALPAGIALPHARSPQISRLTMAIGRTGEPVVWGMRKSWPVDYVFLLAIPSAQALTYISLLSSIARLCSHPDLLAKLRATHEPSSIFELLKQVSVRPSQG